MWARIEEMAIRREVPDALRQGSLIRGFVVGHRLPPIPGNRRYQATREWRTFELRQFYDVRTPAFLAWQHQARYAHLPEHPSFVRACAEWEGGVILPNPRLPSLGEHLARHPLAMNEALDLAYKLAALLGVLHRDGTAHLNLGPESVLCDPRDNTPLLRHFGQSLRSEWQDIWGGCERPALDWRYVPPDFIAGQGREPATDVYSFGGLLQYLLTGRHPSRLRRWAGPLPLAHKFLNILAPAISAPPDVLALMEACLDSRAANRPGMAEVRTELANHARTPFDPEPDTPIPQSIPREPKQRVMVFIKPDRNAPSLFEEAISQARSQQAALLFVSLIPIQLAYGEMEQFKAHLFRTLANGLRQCREHNLLWGLKLLENVDSERAAAGLLHQYGPDRILCGAPKSKGMLAKFRKDLVDTLRQAHCPVLEIAARDSRQA
ncbi:protein kinase domain-containing protein [Salidesulfovibrio onnuriiensis]|uniref:protein kinase domain-containing protein n=1 Tax=Salidesulfovibrio onnuriiensis TaxID=2583823 RepID=UPI0011CC3C5D|nr:protein kinase [Salidesulfovibrio onnuriiensis]